MSTVVLARKYRPRRFDQMVGQEHVVQALTNALERNRLHHAYLFTGTRGIGKTTVSRILAKSLNCTGADGQGGITAEPCGVCSACTEIDSDRYIDYIELDAASNRSIDEIRDLIERAAYKPGVGRYKVFMIDEAHQLTKDAFNALLKTLEEPPEYLKFVLATTDPEKMLPTVLSRCLQFNLRPMAPETVRAHLAHVLEAEQIAFDDGALRLLGRAARGSMRDALSLTDQAIAYGGGALQEAVVRTMLGAVDRAHAARLVEALAQRDGRAVLAAVDGLRAQGLSAAATLEEMAALLQQMAVLQAVPDALDAADPEHEAAHRLHAALAADETQLLYSMLLQGRGELGVLGDEHAALAMVLLRFLAFAPAEGGPERAAAPSPPSHTRSATSTAGTTASASATAPARATAAERARPASDRAGAEPSASAASAAAPARAGLAANDTRATAPTAAGAAPRTVAARAADAHAAPRPAEPSRVADEPPPWALEQPPDDDFESAAAPTRPAAPLRASAPAAIVVPLAATTGQAEAPNGPPAAARVAEPQRSTSGDRWCELVQALVAQGRVAALVRELAWQAGAQAIEERDGATVWTLVVEREALRSDGTRDKLAAALTAHVGVPQQLLLQPGVPVDSAARRDAWERQRRQAEAEQALRDDPAVQQLLAQFQGARIVPGSVRPL